MEEYERLCANLTAPLTHLDRLHDHFVLLATRVRRISYTPGPDAHTKIVPLNLDVAFLARESAQVLSELSYRTYASMPGRNAVLQSLRTLVIDSALATAALTNALQSNPFPTAAPHQAVPPENQQREPDYMMAWHLAESSNLLERSSFTCRNIYDSMVWDLDVADQAPNQRHTAYVLAAQETAARTAAPTPPCKSAPRAAPRR
ncbi:hypothetical protein ACODT3_25015 [Streptomyces sp. 4.24]|uniref:hypothetical protein n=1 Tax=Streptomyces tritrimontium TaxID=3406573 RepID=UPI003BB769D6